MIRDSPRLHRFFEWLPLEYASLIVASTALITGQIDRTSEGNDILFYGSIALLVILVGLFIGKELIPTIDISFSQVGHDNHLELFDNMEIDASNGSAEVDMRFEVPEHHEEVYVSFEIDGYVISINQYDPVNHDNDRAVTYHSSIDNFDLTLRLESQTETSNDGSIQPLKIIDKFYKNEICEISVKG